MQSNIKMHLSVAQDMSPYQKSPFSFADKLDNSFFPIFSRREVKRASAHRLKTCIRLFEILTQAADFDNKENDDFFCIFANSVFFLGSL